MNTVMYGAGNIGRGFIGQKFYLSGHHTTFIDINKNVVDLLNEKGEYPLYQTRGGKYVPEPVKNLNAVDGKDSAAVVKTIADCDLLATALGVNILPFVAQNIADAVKIRAKQNRPLNILICENLIGSNEYLHGLVEPLIPAEIKPWFEANIGFVCVSVGRVVPPTPPQYLAKNPLAVCGDTYDELPVDLAGFRPVGCELPKINNLVAFTPFSFFIERKLLIHNMGHAFLAYVGSLYGYEYIFETTNNGDIKYLLTRALIESARALAKRHGVPTDEMMQFVEDLMIRFENSVLVDSLERVGKDTKRKLGPNDRMVGAFKMVRETGGIPAHIAVGIAAGLLFAPEKDAAAVELSGYCRENGVAAALAKYSDITDPADVKMIKTFYDMFLAKAGFPEFYRVLSEMKTVEH